MVKGFQNMVELQAEYVPLKGKKKGMRNPRPMFISTEHGTKQYYTIPAAIKRGLV